MQSLKQMHLESLNLTLICSIKRVDEWEGVCLARRDVKDVKMPRELAQRRPTCIYRHPIENIPVGPFSGLSVHAPNALQGAPDASGACASGVSPVDMCPSHLNVTVGHVRSLASGVSLVPTKFTPDASGHLTRLATDSVRSLLREAPNIYFADRTRPALGRTESVNSNATSTGSDSSEARPVELCHQRPVQLREHPENSLSH